MKEWTVIIPTHNGADRIGVALQSIVSQCYDRNEVEIIVICDACEDDTHKVAEQYADVVVDVNHHNAGLTRNEGLERATGKWVLFMDDDDRWIHEFVLAQLHRYAEQDDFDVLCFAFWWSRGIALPFDNAGTLFPNVWSKMWRREFIGETRFRNIYPNDDEWFCRDMIAKKPRMSAVDCLMYYYDYMRPGSITDTEERKKNADKE